MKILVRITSSFVYVYGKNITRYLDILEKHLSPSYQLMNKSKKEDKILFFIGTYNTYEINSPEDILKAQDDFRESIVKKKIEYIRKNFNVPIVEFSVSNVMWNGRIERYMIPSKIITEYIIRNLLVGKEIDPNFIYELVVETNSEKIVKEYYDEIEYIIERLQEEFKELESELKYKVIKKLYNKLNFSKTYCDQNRINKLLKDSIEDTSNSCKIFNLIHETILSMYEINPVKCILTNDDNCLEEQKQLITENIIDMYPEYDYEFVYTHVSVILDYLKSQFDNREYYRKVLNNIKDKLGIKTGNIKKMEDELGTSNISKEDFEKIKNIIDKLLQHYKDFNFHRVVLQYYEGSSEGSVIIFDDIEHYDTILREFLDLKDEESEVVEIFLEYLYERLKSQYNGLWDTIVSFKSDKNVNSISKMINDIIEVLQRIDVEEFVRRVMELYGDKIIYIEKPTVRSSKFPGLEIKIRIDEEEVKKKSSKKIPSTVMIVFSNRKFSMTNIRPSTVDIVFGILKLMGEMKNKNIEKQDLDTLYYW